MSEDTMIRRYVKSIYTGDPDDASDTTCDIIWTDRMTGAIVLMYDGADPANTNPAYGASSDEDCFAAKGLDIKEKIPLNKCVVEINDYEIRAEKFAEERAEQIQKEKENAEDLFKVLGNERVKDFSFERYIEGEEKILKPALEQLGYNNVSFYMEERDSFGPLIRGCTAYKDGQKHWFFYG